MSERASMENQFTDELFREVYREELSHAESLDSATNLPTAVLTALGGVGFYYLSIWPPTIASVAAIAYCSITGLFGALFLLATIFLICAVWPKDKAFVATPRELAEYVTDLTAYYQSSENIRDVEILVADELRASLRKLHIEAAEINRQRNTFQMAMIMRTRMAISAAIVCMILNVAPMYFVQKLPRPATDAIIHQSSSDLPEGKHKE